ncbi:glycosyl hydrolase family 18 protein [Acidicapsa acidisoli]|uniref:glycosyl hydrolase family 18 protein n=1 Tax=Acidicapsa acidisoli TaxID=1615681 RepID=UPI0021E0E1BD|nr:glycosyl hydrolase family 18 protein [Acidicapsa acidisoli]
MKHIVRLARLSCMALGILLALGLTSASAAAKPVALFYLGTNPDSIRSFLAHYKQIDLLVPTWYEVDQDGLLTGDPDPTVLEVAHRDKLPVMPLIALFNKKGFHEFAGNHAAWDHMNEAMIREAKLHGYTGFQFDFENVSYLDRDGLTALVKNSADALHKAGLQLSIATVPNAPGYPAGKGGFAKWIYTDWRGAYDIAELAKSVDLLCLMTYDQQTRWTMPGPVAGWQWTVDNLEYALKVVPKEKLSLGIPLYGYHWYTGAPKIDKATGDEQPNQQADYINALDATQLATAYKAKVEWDTFDHSAYFWFYRDQMREWIFYTDLHTFQDRYELVRDRGLQGFCSWVLGAEDPEIWKYLPQSR